MCSRKFWNKFLIFQFHPLKRSTCWCQIHVENSLSALPSDLLKLIGSSSRSIPQSWESYFRNLLDYRQITFAEFCGANSWILVLGWNWALTESYCVMNSENFNKIVTCLCAMRRKFPALFQQSGHIQHNDFCDSCERCSLKRNAPWWAVSQQTTAAKNLVRNSPKRVLQKSKRDQAINQFNSNFKNAQ